METKEIELLLDKYFESETDIQEEILLKAYFNSGEVAPHLVRFTNLFVYFQKEKNTQTTVSPNIPNTNYRNIWLTTIAASLVLFFGINYYFHYQQRIEAQKTLEESKKVFTMIAKQLQKGNEAMYKLNYLEESKNIAFRLNK